MRKSCLLPTLEQTRMLLSSDYFHVFFSLDTDTASWSLVHAQSFTHPHSHTLVVLLWSPPVAPNGKCATNAAFPTATPSKRCSVGMDYSGYPSPHLTLHGLRTRLRSAFANICGFRNPRHARCALRGKVASGCGWWSHIWHEVTSWPHDLDNKTNAVIGSNYNKVLHGISTQTRPRHHCKSNTCQYMSPRVSRSRPHHQPFKNHPTFAVQIC